MEKILVAIYDLKGVTDRKGPNDPKGRLIFFLFLNLLTLFNL